LFLWVHPASFCVLREALWRFLEDRDALSAAKSRVQ
jgi:hypothetical protein